MEPVVLNSTHCCPCALTALCVLWYSVGGRPVTVTWAEPKKEEDTSKVKAIYVGGLPETVTEQKLLDVFKAYGEVCLMLPGWLIGVVVHAGIRRPISISGHGCQQVSKRLSNSATAISSSCTACLLQVLHRSKQQCLQHCTALRCPSTQSWHDRVGMAQRACGAKCRCMLAGQRWLPPLLCRLRR